MGHQQPLDSFLHACTRQEAFCFLCEVDFSHPFHSAQQNSTFLYHIPSSLCFIFTSDKTWVLFLLDLSCRFNKPFSSLIPRLHMKIWIRLRTDLHRIFLDCSDHSDTESEIAAPSVENFWTLAILWPLYNSLICGFFPGLHMRISSEMDLKILINYFFSLKSVTQTQTEIRYHRPVPRMKLHQV